MSKFKYEIEVRYGEPGFADTDIFSNKKIYNNKKDCLNALLEDDSYNGLPNIRYVVKKIVVLDKKFNEIYDEIVH